MRSWIVVALTACASQTAPPPAAPAPAPTPASPAASDSVALEPAAAPAEPAAAPADSAAAPAVSPDAQAAVSPTQSSAPLVPPSVLESRRVKGSIAIPPDDMDKVEMVKRRLTRVVHTSKVCLAVDGHISSVTMLRSSGLPGYDEKIRKQISSTWEYSPFQINGKPAPVCTSVSIIYVQALPQRR